MPIPRRRTLPETNLTQTGGAGFSTRQPPPQTQPVPPKHTYAELADALRNADAAGDTEAAQMLADAIDKGNYIETQSDLVSAGLGFSQGATLGHGEEIAAAIRAGTEQFIDPYLFATEQKMRGLLGAEQPEAWQGKSFGELVDEREQQFWQGKDYMERYRQALATSRGMLETARREDPVATFAGEMAGGVALTGPTAAGAVRGVGVPRGLLRLTGLGTAEGATAGYGYSEASPVQTAMEADPADPESEQRVVQEVQNAAIDAGIGASIGGGVSMAAPLAAGFARKIGQTFTMPFTKEARLREGARREVAEAIKRDLADRNITLQQAQKELRETPGMTAADLGEHMRELTETMVQRPSDGSKEMAVFLRGRNIDQWKRMQPRLAEALTGNRDSNFYAARRQLIADMKQRADDAYSAAYAIPARINQPMLNVLSNKQMRPALKFANEIREAAGKDRLKLDEINTGRMFSTEELDELVRGMDTLVGKTFKKGKGNLGGRLKEMRDQFKEALYQQNPAYREARMTWANDKLNDEALDKGLRIFNDDADLVAEVVREMSPAERNHFKLGALQAITRKLGNKVETADLSKDIWNKPNAREALRIAFGSKSKFDDFMEYVEQEQKMYQTFYEAVGNSRTAKRLAQQEVAQGGGLAYALGYLGSMQLVPNLPMGLAGAVTRKGYETIAAPGSAAQAAMNQQSRELAGMLQSTDLEQLMRPHTIGGLLESGVPVTGAAGTTGLLATEQPYPERQ